MKYKSLDNITNKYPANELGLYKSDLVYVTPSHEFSLVGKYDLNRATYPSVPLDNINVVLNTKFEFIIEFNNGNLWTSDKFYSNLKSAYDEHNPFFNAVTVPRVKLDYNFLKNYKNKNGFKIGEAYCEVNVTNTLDTEEKFCNHIDWLVSSDVSKIELRDINELGSWDILYKAGSTFGLGAKDEYDAMQKGEPNPEGYGAEIIFEQYDLTLPKQAQVTINQPVNSNLDPITELVRIMATIPIPAGRTTFQKFGSGLIGQFANATFGLVNLFTFGLADLVDKSFISTTFKSGGSRRITLEELLGKNYSVNDKYWAFILARENDRAFLSSINTVFNNEKNSDEASWKELLIATGKQMKCVYTTSDVNSALKIILSMAVGNGDGNGTVRKSDYAYAVNVGNGTRWFRTNAVDKFNIKITF